MYGKWGKLRVILVSFSYLFYVPIVQAILVGPMSLSDTYNANNAVNSFVSIVAKIMRATL